MSLDRSSLALQQVLLLQGLATQRLEAIALRCTWHSIEAGKSLLARLEAKTDVHFLVSGQLRVTTYSMSGRQVTFRDLVAGEHFGDIAAIDGKPRSADVVVLAPSVVASLDRAGFLALLREEPVVAERVMQGLAALVRQLSERLIDLSTLDVQNRLQAELLRMATLAGITDNQARFDPAPTHVELASQISTNREQVTRELNAMRREGLLVKDGKALVLTDAQRLQRLVALVRGPL
jgi:CRP-like cAMP-binding protein